VKLRSLTVKSFHPYQVVRVGRPLAERPVLRCILFVNRKNGVRRNEPLHNLGTFYRVAHVRKAIEMFLTSDDDDDDDDDEAEEEDTVKYAKQVINLGSGL